MRILATVCGAFAAGCFAAQYLLNAAWLLPAAVLVGLLIPATLAVRKGLRLRLWLLAAGFALALVWRVGYTQWTYAPAAALSGEERAVTAELCDWPQRTAQGVKVTVSLLTEGQRPIRCTWYGREELLQARPGDRISAQVRMQDAGNIRGKTVTSFTGKGIWLLLYQQGELTLTAAEQLPLSAWPAHVRRAMTRTVEQLYPAEQAALVTGMLVGETDELSVEQSVWLSESGIYHIVSVSGLHCMFLLSVVTLCTGRQRQRLLAGCAIPLVVLYTLVVGAPPSMVRAALMMTLLLAAPLFDRENDSPTALALSLALILLQNPYAAASIALQLTFGAMAGILWLTPKVYGLLRGSGKSLLRRFAAASVATTAGSLALTAPLTALYFNNLVLVSPLANLLTLPLANGIFVGGILSMLLGSLWLPVGQVLAWGVGLLGDAMLLICRALAEVPYHAVYFSNRYLALWLLYVYAMLLLCLLQRRRRSWVLAGTLAAVSLVATVWLNVGLKRPEGLQVQLLDVGQGQSLLLRNEAGAALVDCGSTTTYLTAGDEAADLLLSLGHEKLEYLILTHYHADHANGLPYLLTRLEVERLYLPKLQDETGLRREIEALAAGKGTALCYVEQTATLSLGETVLTVYPPVGTGSHNEEGLSLLATVGDFDLLVTGDMNAATEKRLTAYASLPDIEVLVVGHHGSKFATSAQLLEACTPEVGLVSVGENSYGHPADQALWRMRDEAMTVYRTDLQGTIEIWVHK